MNSLYELNTRDTINSHKIRCGKKYKTFREKILERDNWCCRYCGVGKFNMLDYPSLDVHHIKPFSKFSELRLDDSNCVTLCEHCHGYIEGLRKNQNIELNFTY